MLSWQRQTVVVSGEALCHRCQQHSMEEHSSETSVLKQTAATLKWSYTEQQILQSRPNRHTGKKIHLHLQSPFSPHTFDFHKGCQQEQHSNHFCLSFQAQALSGLSELDNSFWSHQFTAALPWQKYHHRKIVLASFLLASWYMAFGEDGTLLLLACNVSIDVQNKARTEQMQRHLCKMKTVPLRIIDSIALSP